LIQLRSRLRLSRMSGYPITHVTKCGSAIPLTIYQLPTAALQIPLD
jgi:hypothetical protein